MIQVFRNHRLFAVTEYHISDCDDVYQLLSQIDSKFNDESVTSIKVVNDNVFIKTEFGDKYRLILDKQSSCVIE